MARSSGFWSNPAATAVGLWAVATGMLALIGPFGSFPTMPFAGRLVYWGSVVGLAVVLVAILRAMVLQVLGRGRHPFVVDAVLVPLFTLLYAPPLHHVTRRAATSFETFSLMQTAAIVVVVSLVLIVVREIFGLHAPGTQPGAPLRHGGAAEGDTGGAEALPALVERLPDEARGAVLAISGSDHYVEVLTERGRAEILLRFSDALREIDTVPGQRVHRSHWVADTAVETLHREGARHFVVLKTGERLPVSRTYVDHAQRRWGAGA